MPELSRYRPTHPLTTVIVRIAAIAAFLAAYFAATPARTPAKELTSDPGIFIDMPAGFTPGEGDGETRFTYFDPDGHMELDILIFEAGRYASARIMAAEILGKLGSKGDSSSFTYEGRGAVISEIFFSLASGPRKGYALFVSEKRERGYALISHAEAPLFDSYDDLVVSCLDGFSIDRVARRSPGPVSQFLLPWPADRRERRTVALPGGPAGMLWSPEEGRQVLAVAEREHDVLKSYAESDSLLVDAWTRFYRMTYRESAARLDGFADAFTCPLQPCDPTESARRVLAWVQGFTYERDLSGIDFVPPLTAAFERKGDCDSRAMVMAIILERMDIDCVLMLSREYSHAMLAVHVPGAGRRFFFKGREYLVAETTAKVEIGVIDPSHDDFSKWLGCDLGN
jgi:hypothetical protein